MRYFNLNNQNGAAREARPLRTLFLTSVRDIGSRSDHCGEDVTVNGTRVYMRGLVEAIVDSIHAGHEIADHMEVAGIAYDDRPRELQRDGYPTRPGPGDRWIYPLSKRNRGGEPLGDITHHIPSDFRGLKMDDRAGRIEGKAEFEHRVAELMQEVDADIIVSDHLIMRIESLISNRVHNLAGRVLNIHPAITHEDHPYRLRGLTPTKDAIERANRAEDPHFKTGATLHFIADEIDAGAVICDDEPTPVHPDDEPQALRVRNYEMAKIPVFLAGMIHYSRTMFARALADNTNILTQPQNELLYFNNRTQDNHPSLAGR